MTQPTIVLESITDLATVIQNWHSDNLLILQQMYEESESEVEKSLIVHFYQLFQELPYNMEYTINHNVMSA